ncbi:MAG: hypothetical protein NTW67_04355 [Candidatus Woesearchaeota archaeon]|nr:hypothetical protein [Candidatus Woesearchaeota archaeon]
MINHKTDKNVFSLEQRTEKSLIGKVLNFPKKVLATAGLLVALSGINCTVDPTYTRGIDPFDIPRADRRTAVDYKCKNIESLKQLSDGILECTSLGATIGSYKAPEALRKEAGALGKDAQELFSMFEKQNDLVARLSSSRMAYLLVDSFDRNVDYDLGVKTDPAELENVKKDLAALQESIKNLDFEKRQKFLSAFKRVKSKDEFERMLKFNREGLDDVDRMLRATADIETIEGYLGLVDSANHISAEILKSQTGFDQYGKAKGEGRFVLDELLGQKVTDIITEKSVFADVYKDPQDLVGKSLRSVYEELLGQIELEARESSPESMHRICNKYLAAALSMACEAHKVEYSDPKTKTSGRLISDEQYQAIVRIMVDDALSAFEKSGKQAHDGSVSLGKILESILPLYSFAVPFDVGRTALSRDHKSPEQEVPSLAMREMLAYGNRINNGFMTRDNFVGSAHGRRAEFYSAIASSLAQAGVVAGSAAYNIAGIHSMLYTAFPKTFPQLGPEKTQHYNPVTQGGEEGGPDIGPKK